MLNISQMYTRGPYLAHIIPGKLYQQYNYLINIYVICNYITFSLTDIVF